MTDIAFDPPSALISRRREFLAAQDAYRKVLDEWPATADLLAGAEASLQLRSRTETAHKLMQDAAVDIFQHPWWGTIEPSRRHEAEAALRSAAGR